MSVDIQSFETVCHQPCPDMPCYSLNAEQKAKGLAALEKTRGYLKELQLERLRVQHKKLTDEANREDTTKQRKMRISEELKRINTQAQRVNQRWA